MKNKNQKKNKKKIILLTPVLSHYRQDLYHNLANSGDFDWLFVGGNEYQNIKSIDHLNSKTFSYWSFSLLNHRFYYLKGAVKNILRNKPDMVISSGIDFHLIHTLWLYIIYRIILRKKFIWWSQGTPGHQGRIGWLARKLFYKSSSGVLLYSRAGYENMLKMNVHPYKSKVIGNCLNKEDYGFLNHAINKESTTDEKLHILFSGRLIPKAKLEILIQALGILKSKGYNDYKCTIIGDGDLEHYKELTNTYQVQDVVSFTGSLYGKAAHSYFLKSDLFVYPGGIGLSILHALSFGLPVITTDNDSLHFPEIELLKKGLNGDVYHDNDAVDLADKILIWKDKILKNKKLYADHCLCSIKENGYLPDEVSEKILFFLKKGK